MIKSDHIALTLAGAGVRDCEDGAVPSVVPIARKSLRRSWNQLSRCQRNLIILVIFAMSITLVFLLPSQNLNADKQITITAAHHLLDINFNNEQNMFKQNNPKNSKNDDDISVHSRKRDIEITRDNNVPNVVPAPAPQQQKPEKDQESEHQHHPANDLQNIENVVNVPQTLQNHHHLEPVDFAQDINKNSIGEHDDTKLDSVSNDRTEIELAIQDPASLPGQGNGGGVSIEEFLGQINMKYLPQKQHFHGSRNERQEAVVNAFKHSWTGYKKFAWGHDNLKPVSESSYDWFGLGLTIVDSLDTMYIMGLEDEFMEARNWVSQGLNFDINRDVNLFEVTIRVLGGLLSAYHLSADKIFLQKSIELGNRLLPCFLSPSGIPYSDVNLAALSAHAPKWSPDSSTSEVTTIQLEFRDLSRTTNVTLYERLAHRVNEKIHALDKNNGLVPIFINANTGTFRNYATISLGARGDSYYEYLLKQWIQTGHKENDFLITDYLRAIDGVFSQLLRRTPKENHAYIGELINGKDFKPKMDHLTCYLPGTLLLGHHFGLPDSHLLLARDLLDTCYQTYMKQPTQLAAEISYFAVGENEELDIYVKPNDAHNLLRPEFIESLYYFYALTGNRTYQDMGWTIFQAFEKHTKVTNGYTSIGNVKNIFNIRLRDMMESFWLGETLKYFYLLFSDNPKEIDLDKWVFNTEAHPLPIRKN